MNDDVSNYTIEMHNRLTQWREGRAQKERAERKRIRKELRKIKRKMKRAKK